jgi:hypothetical protein
MGKTQRIAIDLSPEALEAMRARVESGEYAARAPSWKQRCGCWRGKTSRVGWNTCASASISL